MPDFKRIVIISDGIRGHIHQSLGVGEWLERLSGAMLDPTMVNIPEMTFFDRVLKLKMFVQDHSDADFVLWNGNRALIKREQFERYMNEQMNVI